ncbi:uncharacterized protein PAC_15962 [Phialocephala subalpina]|uniref:Uncharacterized protein n=1 Tax=Phialocephala subalpina TaxID=576137 RepID=A0A1L7XLX6_9HELO|nr:uncharacterized protein PAC_15962 [Phialocephala subalpina]
MSREAREKIMQLARFYEASDSQYFLDKIRNILSYIDDGKVSELRLSNSMPDEHLLYFKFGMGNRQLTDKESKELSNIVIADLKSKKQECIVIMGSVAKSFQEAATLKPAHFKFAYGAESVR